MTGGRHEVYHVFNASHDEALAGGAGGALSAAARRIDADLAVLPYWYARSGEAVCVPDAGAARSFLRSLPVSRPVAVTDSFPRGGEYRIEPWGWDGFLVRELVRRGVPREFMPGEGFLRNLRELQSRETVAKFLPALLRELRASPCGAAEDAFAGGSSFARTEEELRADPVFASGRYILKRPWSGSGRGLYAAGSGCPERAAAWRAEAFRMQGGVEVQPFLDKAEDCAAEFFLPPGGAARLLGFSRFRTAHGGFYAGNAVEYGAEDRLRRSLGGAGAALSAAAEALRHALPAVLRGYSGPLGVDMMICRLPGAGGRRGLFPCVEINLRRTMGMVALALAPLLADGREGEFRVAHAQRRGGMLALLESMRKYAPPEIAGGKLAGGCLPLTPAGEDTRFHACLAVKAAAGG